MNIVAISGSADGGSGMLRRHWQYLSSSRFCRVDLTHCSLYSSLALEVIGGRIGNKILTLQKVKSHVRTRLICNRFTIGRPMSDEMQSSRPQCDFQIGLPSLISRGTE